MIHIAMALLLLCCATNFGCGVPMSAECQQFYGFHIDKRDEVLRSYTLDKQYRIYRCGMENIKPQDQGPAFIIAERGEQVIPFLLDKLNTENKSTTEDILLIFSALSKKGHLRDRKDVVGILEQHIAAMETGQGKEQAYKRLLEIQSISY